MGLKVLTKDFSLSDSLFPSENSNQFTILLRRAATSVAFFKEWESFTLKLIELFRAF